MGRKTPGRWLSKGAERLALGGLFSLRPKLSVKDSVAARSKKRRRGFGVAPILYMLGLIGVGAGVLFSGYSQTLKNNITLANSLSAKQELDGAATTLAATSVLGATDNGVLCPPQGGTAGTGTNCANAPTAIFDVYPSLSPSLKATDPRLPANYNTAEADGSPVEVGVFAPSAGVKQIDSSGHYYL
jgi:hypothetical protein